MSWLQKELVPRCQRKQRGIPDKESPGIFIPKGDRSWRQKKRNSEVPAGQFIRSVQFLRRSKLAPKGNNSEGPEGQRESFYIVYNFYVDPSWRQEEIIPKCQRDIFVPAGQFLRSVQFLRRSELAPKELILGCQRNNFAPIELEIQICV